MESQNPRHESFKVPKLKPRVPLEEISLKSSQYLSDIWPKLVSNFFRPAISEKKLKISSGWLINNSKAEDRHIKRRQMMRRNMPMLTYSVGFVFVSDFQKLRLIAKSGTIENGNIKNSHLGKSTMGVSLCQFADIFHQGHPKTGVPDRGYLVLIKYLKGRINYVVCDSSPTEPQPQFDCHMVKTPSIGNNTACAKAFHKSQVFIYDYNDDGEIVNGLSKILPFAAVEFKWVGSYLFQMTKQHIPRTSWITDERPPETQCTSPKNIENERHLASFSNHVKNATSIVPLNLTIKGSVDIKMKANAYLYLTNSINSLLRSDNDWELEGVLEVTEFEKELKRLQVNLNSTCCPSSSKDLLDPLSQDIIISLNKPNILSTSEVDVDSLHLNEFSNVPQYVTYTRLVLDNYEYSVSLGELLKHSKSMGFISRPFDPEISILIFTDGELSKKLGIPTVVNASYFHGLVFHSQNPLFIVMNKTIGIQKEKDIYFSCLSTFKKQNIQSKFNNLQSPLKFDVLKQTVKSQSEVQKTFLMKLVKPQSNCGVISYKSICFEDDCEDFNCLFHNPTKKARMDESTNKENIENCNVETLLSPENPSQKGIERHCLSEKLFDYFKNDHIPAINAEDNGNKCLENSSEVLQKKSNPQPVKKAVEIQIEYKQKKTQNNNHSEDFKEKGSFFSLEFLNYSKAAYKTTDGFKTTNFKSSKSFGFYDINDEMPTSLWSLDQSHFKLSESLFGSSTYE